MTALSRLLLTLAAHLVVCAVAVSSPASLLVTEAGVYSARSMLPVRLMASDNASTTCVHSATIFGETRLDFRADTPVFTRRLHKRSPMPIRKNGRNDYFSEDEPNVFDKLKKQGRKVLGDLIPKKINVRKHLADPSNDDLPGSHRMRTGNGSSSSGKHTVNEAPPGIDHVNDDLPSRYELKKGSHSAHSGKRFSFWKARRPSAAP